jgi:hypothetical protein
LKPPGITNPWTDRFALLSSCPEVRLVGKSDVVGDCEREWLAVAVGGVERGWLEKVRAESTGGEGA